MASGASLSRGILGAILRLCFSTLELQSWMSGIRVGMLKYHRQTNVRCTDSAVLEMRWKKHSTINDVQKLMYKNCCTVMCCTETKPFAGKCCTVNTVQEKDHVYEMVCRTIAQEMLRIYVLYSTSTCCTKKSCTGNVVWKCDRWHVVQKRCTWTVPLCT